MPQFGDLERQLIAHEGLRLQPYLDTEGNLTIGVGYNVTARGWRPLEQVIGRTVDTAHPSLTRAEALEVLENDIAAALGALLVRYRWSEHLDPVRQRVLVNMCFNLGIDGLSEFRLMLDAARRGAWATAAREMLNSRWARQVKGRAVTLAEMMRTGADAPGVVYA